MPRKLGKKSRYRGIYTETKLRIKERLKNCKTWLLVQEQLEIVRNLLIANL